MRVLNRLWKDEAGFIVSSELVLVATILVIGMVVGLTTVRDQVVQELADVAGAISDVNQSYHYTGVEGHTSSTAGSDFVDKVDYCDGNGQESAGTGTNCVNVNVKSSFEEKGGHNGHNNN